MCVHFGNCYSVLLLLCHTSKENGERVDLLWHYRDARPAFSPSALKTCLKTSCVFGPQALEFEGFFILIAIGK